MARQEDNCQEEEASEKYKDGDNDLSSRIDDKFKIEEEGTRRVYTLLKREDKSQEICCFSTERKKERKKKKDKVLLQTNTD